MLGGRPDPRRQQTRLCRQSQLHRTRAGSQRLGQAGSRSLGQERVKPAAAAIAIVTCPAIAAAELPFAARSVTVVSPVDVNATPPMATLTVPSQPAYLIVCRQALIGAVADLAVTDDQLDDLKLLLSEACSNAIVHGYDNDPTGVIEVEFRTSPYEIEVAVSDNGRGFPGGRLPDQPGFGLSLLHDLSTRHSIDPQRPEGGARVSFARSINR